MIFITEHNSIVLCLTKIVEVQIMKADGIKKPKLNVAKHHKHVPAYAAKEAAETSESRKMK